jgi:hypothetical protein
VKNGVFLANKKRVHLLQEKFVGVQPFIAAKVKMLQEKRIVHEAIKI